MFFLSNAIKYSCFLGNLSIINKKSFGRTSRLFPAETTQCVYLNNQILESIIKHYFLEPTILIKRGCRLRVLRCIAFNFLTHVQF